MAARCPGRPSLRWALGLIDRSNPKDTKMAGAASSSTGLGTFMAGLARFAFRRPVTSIVVVAVAATALVHIGDFVTYSDGTEAGRKGRITKFSHKGFAFCSSWEGQLSMEGFRNAGQGGASNIFEFSVQDPKVREQIIQAYNNNDLVSLGYIQTFTHWSCRRATDYWIVKVAVLKPNQQEPLHNIPGSQEKN